MSENRSLADLLDSVATATPNAVDCYGWIVPATFLTLLFIAALVIVCWQLDDLPLEGDIFTVPHAIFAWARKRWQKKPTSDISQ